MIRHCLLTVSAASSEHFFLQISLCVFDVLEAFLPTRYTLPSTIVEVLLTYIFTVEFVWVVNSG